MHKRFQRHKMRKRPGTPALYSFLIPGVGQIYNREVLKGVIMILLAISLLVSFLLLSSWYINKTRAVSNEAIKLMDQLNIEEQIAKIAIISHYCFASIDLAVHSILELVRREIVPDNSVQMYLGLLNQKDKISNRQKPKIIFNDLRGSH